MICLVNGPEGQRLIKAKSNQAAIDFVVAERFTSKAVNSDELYELTTKSGLKVEEAPEKIIQGIGSVQAAVESTGGANG